MQDELPLGDERALDLWDVSNVLDDEPATLRGLDLAGSGAEGLELDVSSTTDATIRVGLEVDEQILVVSRAPGASTVNHGCHDSTW